MKKIYKRFVKRFLDITLAFLLLIVLFPIFIIISLLIKCTSNGNAIFTQYRMGYKGDSFKLYKFRTMMEDAPDNVATRDISDPSLYITKVGRILRETSLDEIPQLINIIKGEMSFIGPRPVILNEKELIDLRAKCGVDNVKPGISGLAQINGRDKVGLEKKIELDKYYADNISFWLDTKIFIKTIFYVFNTQDVVEGKIDESTNSVNDTAQISD